MEVKMSSNNNLYSQPNYVKGLNNGGNNGNGDTQNPNPNPNVPPGTPPVPEQSVPLNPTNYQEVLNNLNKKTEQQSTNLTEQREIINKVYTENKVLQEQLAKTEKQLELARQGGEQNPKTPADSNITDEFMKKFNSMEQTIQAMKQEKLETKFRPILTVFEEFGVNKNEVKGYLDTIRQNFNVDLVTNPNIDLAKFALQKLRHDQEPGVVIPGGYGQSQQIDQQQLANEAAYNERRNHMLQQYADYAKSKKEK